MRPLDCLGNHESQRKSLDVRGMGTPSGNSKCPHLELAAYGNDRHQRSFQTGSYSFPQNMMENREKWSQEATGGGILIGKFIKHFKMFSWLSPMADLGNNSVSSLSLKVICIFFVCLFF